MTTPNRHLKVPQLRERDGVALVTLRDARTGKRNDFRLGAAGTTEASEAYHRLIAEWEARGRCWPLDQPSAARSTARDGVTIVELIANYAEWANGYYHPRFAQTISVMLGLLRRSYGSTPAADFGPKKLRLLRDAMIRGEGKSRRSPRPWSRKYINAQIKQLRHMFKWAASHELVPASVHQALCTIEPLRRGRTAAHENPRVEPVPDWLLEKVRPFMSPMIRALVALQLYSGARPGELLGMRLCDIEMDRRGGIWTFRPDQHKNAYREKERVIYFGPKAQQVLEPFIQGAAHRRGALQPARRRSAAPRGTHRAAQDRARPGQRRGHLPQRPRPGKRPASATPPPATTARCSMPANGASLPRRHSRARRANAPTPGKSGWARSNGPNCSPGGERTASTCINCGTTRRPTCAASSGSRRRSLRWATPAHRSPTRSTPNAIAPKWWTSCAEVGNRSRIDVPTVRIQAWDDGESGGSASGTRSAMIGK
jgi:integrase